MGDRSGRNGNDSSIFDDKEDTIVHTPPSLKQVFGSSSISSVDGLVGEEENAYYIDGRGTVMVIRSETELLLKHFKGEIRYDVVLAKTDKGIGSLAMDEEGE